MALDAIAAKSLRVVSTAVACALAVLSVGCSASCSVSVGGKKTRGTYSGHGVSFTIPDGWSRLKEMTKKVQSGNEIWSEGFAPASGSDLVSVTAYETNVTVTEANADSIRPEVKSWIENLLAGGDGTLVSGPTQISKAGMTGFRFETTFSSNSGEPLESTQYTLWDGNTEYFIGCQHRSQGSYGDEIERGCATIVDSFELT
jgi:hypothetical protein